MLTEAFESSMGLGEIEEKKTSEEMNNSLTVKECSCRVIYLADIVGFC